MKRTLFTSLLLLSFAGFAQEAGAPDPKAMNDSRELTREANQDLAEDDFVNAEANYRRAIAKSPENTAAPYNLGHAYYRNDSYGEAFGRFKEAGERAEEKPQKHKSFHNMGNVFMKQKVYKQAVEAYKEALRNDPADEETRYNLALAKELLKKEEEQKQDEDSQDDQQEDEQEEEKENQEQNEGENGQEEQEDQQQDGGEEEKEENQEGDGERKEEQDRKPEQNKEQPRPNQLSPQQIQNLLQAMENEEKKVKEKIDAQKIQGAPVKTEKDW